MVVGGGRAKSGKPNPKLESKKNSIKKTSAKRSYEKKNKADRYKSNAGASRRSNGSLGKKWGGGARTGIKYLGYFMLVVLPITLIVFFKPLDKLMGLMEKQVAQIDIECEFKFVEKSSIEEKARELIKKSFVDLDIEQVKASFESDPWVDRVSVTREWPDKMLVKVTEQKPIARWGDNSFLNMRGDLVPVDNVEKLAGFPFLKANDRYAKDVMQQFFKMGKLVGKYELSLISMELDETMAWTLELDGSVKVKLGRDHLWDKLQKLMVSRDGVLKENFLDVDVIDMRYQSGFSVAWKNAKGSETRDL